MSVAMLPTSSEAEGTAGHGVGPAARRGSDALGLVGMEERALALGGRLELRSTPGEGTRVRLCCPATLRRTVSAA